MAKFLNDRQRIELGLPMHMLLAVLMAGTNDIFSDIADEARELLLEAASQPLCDLPIAHQIKLVRRVKRLHSETLASAPDGPANTADSGLASIFMLRAITNCGFLIIGEASDFAKALDLMLPAIGSKMTAATGELAKQRARAWLVRLRSLGYYDDPGVIECLDQDSL